MKKLLLLMFALLSEQTLASDDVPGMKMATQSPMFIKLKREYSECVLTKGVSFSAISTVTETIHFAPIACKRELLKIKQFLLSGAFKIDVIESIIESIKEGVEIDLVNSVLQEKLDVQRNVLHN